MIELSVINSCPVCLETINENNKYVTPCKHIFCQECILQIAKNEQDIIIKCPLCRDIFILNHSIEAPKRTIEGGQINLLLICIHHIIILALGIYSIYIFIEYSNFIKNYVPTLCDKVTYCPLGKCYPVIDNQFILSSLLNCLVFSIDILTPIFYMIHCLNIILKGNPLYTQKEIKFTIIIYIIQVIPTVLQLVTLPIFSWKIISPDSCTEAFNHILMLVSIFISIKISLTLPLMYTYFCIKIR